MCVFTHVQFTLTSHSCAQLPTQHLARCKSTMNAMEWIVLAAQNVKTPWVTKAPNLKQFFSSKWFKAVEADRRWLSTKDNAISQRPPGHTWRHFWLPGWWSPTRIYWVEARDAAKQPPKHRAHLLSHHTESGSKTPAVLKLRHGGEVSLSQKRKCSKWSHDCCTKIRLTDTNSDLTLYQNTRLKYTKPPLNSLLALPGAHCFQF